MVAKRGYVPLGAPLSSFLTDPPLGSLVSLPTESGGYNSLHIKLIGIQQEPYQRLRIVRLILNIGEYKDSFLLMGFFCIRRAMQHYCTQQGHQHEALQYSGYC